MKRKLAWGLLGAEGIIILAMEVLGLKLPGVFTSIMAFPFEQIGGLLRRMSLSGSAGNAWAIVIFSAISLLPAVYWLIFRMKKGFIAADALLAVMTAALFGGLYIMINPGYLPGGMGTEMEKAVVGCALHSVWVGYAILRIVENLRTGSRRAMIKCLKGLLWALAAAFVYVIFGACTGEVINGFADLAARNTMPGLNLLPTKIFIILGAINSALPYAMDIPVVFAAVNLAEEFSRDEYGEGAADCAETLSRRCGRALTVTVISSVAFNMLQLAFAPMLHIVDTAVQLPILSVIFSLTALLAAGYMRKGREMKQDNDLFI